MALTSEQSTRFRFHPATDEDTKRAHGNARTTVEFCADALLELMPVEAGRERAVVLTKLEEALMWTNKGIAIHGPGDAGLVALRAELEGGA